MLTMLTIVAMGKDKEPRNKVRFFVKAVRDDMYWLYIKDKKGNISFIGLDEDFNNLWGLNPDDFTDMKKSGLQLLKVLSALVQNYVFLDLILIPMILLI